MQVFKLLRLNPDGEKNRFWGVEGRAGKIFLGPLPPAIDFPRVEKLRYTVLIMHAYNVPQNFTSSRCTNTTSFKLKQTLTNL